MTLISLGSAALVYHLNIRSRRDLDGENSATIFQPNCISETKLEQFERFENFYPKKTDKLPLAEENILKMPFPASCPLQNQLPPSSFEYQPVMIKALYSQWKLWQPIFSHFFSWCVDNFQNFESNKVNQGTYNSPSTNREAKSASLQRFNCS